MAEAHGVIHRLAPGGIGADDRARCLLQFDRHALEHAHVPHPGPLALPADDAGDAGGAQVGGIGEHFRESQGAVLALEIGNRETADLNDVGGIERIPDVDGAGIQPHRQGLEFERAAGFVRAGDGAVEAFLGARGPEPVGVVIGQRHHRQDFAGVHVHHDAGGADRAEHVLRGEQFLPHHVLHTDVQGQAQRLAGFADFLVERHFGARDPVFVDIDPADHVRGDAAQRVMALLGLAEIDAGDAQIVDAGFLVRGDLAFEVDEPFALVGQALDRALHVQARQHGFQFPRDIGGIGDGGGVREDRACGLRHGQRLAHTIDDHRPLSWQDAVGDRFQRPVRDRRNGFLRHLRLHRVQDGDPGDARADDGEHRGETAGGDDQPAAAAIHCFPAAFFGGGDVEMLHPLHRVVRRRAAADP